MGQPYLYSGLEASLYDALDELSDFDDLEFYRLCLQACPGPALDVGCGTGRTLIPLRERGEDVAGLELSPEMLALCRANLAAKGVAARLYQGDMRNFDLESERFATVMAPGYTIQLLVDETDALACLKSCRRHLRRGGQLVLPTYMPWDMIWDGRDSCPLELRREVKAEDGSELVAYQGWELDRRGQLLFLRNRYECRRLGVLLEVEEKEMALRWHLPHEMMALLGAAGFSDVALYGDFSQAPPDGESESVIYVATG